MNELQENLDDLTRQMDEKRIAPDIRQKIFSLLATQIRLINIQLAGPVGTPISSVPVTQPQPSQTTTIQSICPHCKKSITINITP